MRVLVQANTSLDKSSAMNNTLSVAQMPAIRYAPRQSSRSGTDMPDTSVIGDFFIQPNSHFVHC